MSGEPGAANAYVHVESTSPRILPWVFRRWRHRAVVLVPGYIYRRWFGLEPRHSGLGAGGVVSQA